MTGSLGSGRHLLPDRDHVSFVSPKVFRLTNLHRLGIREAVKVTLMCQPKDELCQAQIERGRVELYDRMDKVPLE